MIFLDNNSTTKLDERVLEKMLPYLKENFGNPHSNFHNYGLISRNAVEESRETIANLFNVNHENVNHNVSMPLRVSYEQPIIKKLILSQ